jgi:hypothetical protein
MAEVAPTIAAGTDPTVVAVDSPKQTNDTMKLFSSEGKNVTTKLSYACSVKDKRLDIFRQFEFHKLVLTSASGTRKEYHVNQNFFTSGGNGIVIGLHENSEASGLPEKSELPDFIVKIGCGSGKLKDDTVDNAIRAKELFSKLGEEFKDNMALFYGDILNESNVKIGEFALYKYLGAEILKYEELLKTIEGKQKLIKLAIECIKRYQSKSLVHRDVCPENMVYNSTTNQVNLIDFDDMFDLSFLKTEDEEASCILTQSKSRQGDIIHVCMNTEGQENCINIFNLQPRPLTPDIINISQKLIRASVKDPKQYLQSFLTMDYYGLFWIILYILLYPMNIKDIEREVFSLLITNNYINDYANYDRIYNFASKISLANNIYETMPTEYNSNSMIMKFVELVLHLIKDRPADFSLETLLASDFLVDPRIQETITRMKEEQDAIDKEDLPTILDKIDQTTKAIQKYIDFRKTVRVRRKMLKSNEDFKTKIKTMNGMAGELSILETQVGGNQTKYSKHKKTNRYMNKKKIVGRYNTNKKSKPTKSSR